MSGALSRTNPYFESKVPKALLYYPEGTHQPDKEECERMNGRLMRHLMNHKMRKNVNFVQTALANIKLQQSQKVTDLVQQN